MKKCKGLALTLRTEGNGHFKLRNFSAALEKYNQVYENNQWAC